MKDPYNLQRFVDAQVQVYSDVLKELRRGMKTGHWIWYVFPQLRGLGHSEMSQVYAISSIEEAKAYSEHTLLGKRLVQCTELVLLVKGSPIQQIFGHPDYMKFRSCMTLFGQADQTNGIYQKALDKFFDGIPDTKTIQALEEGE